jgi:predicted phage-related endonuclease
MIETYTSMSDIPPSLVLALISHSEEWHQNRRLGIGGSDAKKIMGDSWYSLWEEKTGRTEGEDLSDVLRILMGTWTEPLNRYWFEKKTGMSINMADLGNRVHAEHNFLRANLDGRVGLGIWEGKHTNSFGNKDEVYNTYYPQCQHNMMVLDAPLCYLSVFKGNGDWHYFEIEEDRAYQAQLLEREREFWNFVTTDTPPENVDAGMEPTALDNMRVVDMSGVNSWASAAHDFLTHYDAAKAHEKAKKTLKELVEADVKEASGHGVVVTRNAKGALTPKKGK